MQINIPQEQYDKLAELANAAGHVDVSAFIAALAAEATADPRGPMSDEELRMSAAECERGIAEIEAGGGRDFREAMIEIGRERGFSLPK
jgi:hypothetical protein